jgi:hypothetical protein
VTADQGDVRLSEPDAEADGPDESDGAPIDDAEQAMPPVPDSIREAGRLAPDHWLGMVDPAWTGEGTPPSWALVGQWRSSPQGEIVEWRENEEYRPSPSARGWPEPVDDVDAAVQLAAAGYRTGEAVTEALAALPEAAIFVTAEGEPLPATAPDGATRVVPVFTSPVFLHSAGRLAYTLLSVRDLVARIPAEHQLYVNPSAAVSMTVDVDLLRAALDAGSGETSDRAPAQPSDQASDTVAPTRPTTVGGEVPVTGDS